MAQNDVTFSIGADAAELARDLQSVATDIEGWAQGIQDALRLGFAAGDIDEELAKKLFGLSEKAGEIGAKLAEGLETGIPLFETMWGISEGIHQVAFDILGLEEKRLEVLEGINTKQKEETEELLKQLKIKEDMTTQEVLAAEAAIRRMEAEAESEEALATRVDEFAEGTETQNQIVSWFANAMQIAGGAPVPAGAFEATRFREQAMVRGEAGEEQAKILREAAKEGNAELERLNEKQVDQMVKTEMKNDRKFEKLLDSVDDIPKALERYSPGMR